MFGSRSSNSTPIAAAFLPLNRPTILLDTNSPGRHAGYSSLCSMPPHGLRTARSAVSRGINLWRSPSHTISPLPSRLLHTQTETRHRTASGTTSPRRTPSCAVLCATKVSLSSFEHWFNSAGLTPSLKSGLRRASHGRRPQNALLVPMNRQRGKATL